jgi:hypothetical protein
VRRLPSTYSGVGRHAMSPPNSKESIHAVV